MSTVRRKEDGKWAAGKSANPGGRPKIISEIRERCQNFMDSEGWDKLFGIARGQGQLSLKAIELIAAYGYGRPPKKLEHTGADGGPIEKRVV